MSKNVTKYLREFCAQVSQIVFLADLTVLRLFTTVWKKNITKIISPRDLFTNVTNRVFNWFDRFYVLLKLYEQKFQKNSYLREFCAQVSKTLFLADLTLLRLITTVWANLSRNSYLREFCAKVSQVVFKADLTVLRLFTTLWTKTSQNSYLHEFCAQLSKMVFLADLTVLRLFTTVWAKMSQNSYLHEF